MSRNNLFRLSKGGKTNETYIDIRDILGYQIFEIPAEKIEIPVVPLDIFAIPGSSGEN